MVRVVRKGGNSKETSPGEEKGIVLCAKMCLAHPPFSVVDGGFEKNFCHRGGEIYE